MSCKISSIKQVAGILFILMLLSTTGLSATIYVPDDYATIQEGVNVANPGDTVVVREGTHITQYTGVTTGITVPQGVTLRFLPGAIVKFGGLRYLSVRGDLIADGTSDAPIVFTSGKDDSYGGDTNDDGNATTPAKDDWAYIAFWDTCEGSIMNHTIVKYAGYSPGYPGSRSPAIIVNTSNLVISNSAIAENGFGGITVSGTSPEIIDNVISDNYRDGIRLSNASPLIIGNTITRVGQYHGGYGIYASSNSNPIIEDNIIGDNPRHPIALDPSSSGAHIQSNDLFGPYRGILIRAGELQTSVTWNSDSVYVIGTYEYYVHHLTINEGVTLTIEPGVVVKVEPGAVLYVSGDLIAEGTLEAKIIFTSLKDDSYGGDTNGDGSLTTPAKDDWGGISLSTTCQQGVLNYVVITYAGQSWSFPDPMNTPAIQVQTPNIQISNSIISDNGYDGIRVSFAIPGQVIIENNIISRNGSYAYGIVLGNVSATVTGNVISENWRGIHLVESYDSRIYLNDFVDNTYGNASGIPFTTLWNSSEEITYTYKGNSYTNYLGNYWDDYQGIDGDGDGIGFPPYSIGLDFDYYPLMMPFENYEIGGGGPPENQPPIADFTCPETADSGEYVTFDASGSNDPDGEITSYEWDFGDGETATGSEVTHRFRGSQNQAKDYVVTLIVTDNDGATSAHPEPVHVGHLTKIVPVKDDGYDVKTTVFYNWVSVDDSSLDVYVVSKIVVASDSSWLFKGACEAAIVTGDDDWPIWRDACLLYKSGQTQTWLSPFPTTTFIGVPCEIATLSFPIGASEPVETFEGIRVHANDYIRTSLIGLVAKLFPPAVTMVFDEAMSEFEPTSPVESLPWYAKAYLQLLLLLAHSPIEIHVYDSDGNVTGMINGQAKEEITDSACDEQTNTIIVLCPGESLRYVVVGKGEGTYGLGMHLMEGNGERISFTAMDIPTFASAVHKYKIDWDALSAGGEGVILEVDSDGDGNFENIVVADSDLTSGEFALQTETFIDLDPDTLSLASRGKFVTMYIELPEGFDVSEIDVSSLMLNSFDVSFDALPLPVEIGDYDEDGIADLMIKFDRQAIIEALELGEQVVYLTGRLSDGTPLAGIDLIRVIH